MSTDIHLEEFDIKDPWLQEFLWTHLVASDVRSDFTKLDAMASIKAKALAGECVFIGCKNSNVVMRCMENNPKVIEPHIMGNGLRMRSVTRAAIPVAWDLGYERIVVWTQYEQIARAMRSVGFNQDAVIPQYHLHDGKLLDIYVLSLSKGEQHEHLPAKTLLTG